MQGAVPLPRAEGKGLILGELSMVKARSLTGEGEPTYLGSSDKPEPWGSAWKELEGSGRFHLCSRLEKVEGQS